MRTAPVTDARWAHPAHHSVAYYPHAAHWAPRSYWYRPYYARWWCHPYYRWTSYTTIVVGFPFVTYAWTPAWAPPYRAGWAWSPGYWAYGYWNPGYWIPATPAPPGYVYTQGGWYDDTYTEGYYRAESRDGWDWIEGHYAAEGQWVPGYWMPTGDAPDGYVWEPGFFDGESYLDGFWRPEYREDFQWVSAYFDRDGLFHAGYWQPLEERAGELWIPGWFDGNTWVEGYWVSEAEYQDADPDAWKPADGWEGGDAPKPAQAPPPRFEQEVKAPARPLAIPVTPPEE